MSYLAHTPARPLGDFVERLWLFSDAPPHGKERIVPSGTVELVINLHENEFRIYDPAHAECCKRFSGAMVSGTYRECFVIDTSEHASIIGVHFRAGGAFPFFQMPVSELANRHVELETLWGASATELREQLCAAATRAQRFILLEKALTAHLFHPLQRHYAVRLALNRFAQSASVLTIGDMARTAGFSHRRFIQVFAQEVGMSPKLFGRVQRFQQALRSMLHTKAPNWAQIAPECGYFDQSHFIRDFRLFSHLTPTEYLRQRSEQVLQNHVPLAA
jgi:AraC-like DNA-binding protein